MDVMLEGRCRNASRTEHTCRHASKVLVQVRVLYA